MKGYGQGPNESKFRSDGPIAAACRIRRRCLTQRVQIPQHQGTCATIMFGYLDPQGRSDGVGASCTGPTSIQPPVLGCSGNVLRGSKYPMLKVPGPQIPLRVWFLEPETSNIGYLDPLGLATRPRPTIGAYAATWGY